MPRFARCYLARHANASYWVDFQDFGFFRMAIADIYFVGGFGSMGWVMPDDYARAAVDPLADEASGLIHEFNTEQAETLLLLARVLGNVEAQQATVTALDRLGFTFGSPRQAECRVGGWPLPIPFATRQRSGPACRLGRSGERGSPGPAFAVVGACTSSCEHPARLFFSTQQFIS